MVTYPAKKALRQAPLMASAAYGKRRLWQAPLRLTILGDAKKALHKKVIFFAKYFGY